MSHRYPNFSFTWTACEDAGLARLGEIKTPHGTLQTPAFIFCATKGAIKAVSMPEMKAAETQIVLSNTYHMMLQPGSELVQKMGGLHKFCGWNGPMLTDSGGFQIFSLGHGSVSDEIKGKKSYKNRVSIVKIKEEGASFRSYIDGKKWLLTPEKSIQVQRQLGADLIVVLDECTPFHVDKRYTQRSMEMSHRWALRSLAEFDKGNDHSQALYGIVQGGVYEDLRQRSIDFVNEQDFFGHAIGGCLGEMEDQMDVITAFTAARLRKDRPIHLLGIGTLRHIFAGVRQGIDTFDCVHPTRIARHGGALVKGEKREHIQIRNACHREDPRPLEADCACPTCTGYSRAYLHHLFKAKEILGIQLLTLHNVYFMNRLLKEIRQGLKEGNLSKVEDRWLNKEK